MKQIFCRLVERNGQEHVKELGRVPVAGEAVEIAYGDGWLLSLHVEHVTHTPDDRCAARVRVITGSARPA